MTFYISGSKIQLNLTVKNLLGSLTARIFGNDHNSFLSKSAANYSKNIATYLGGYQWNLGPQVSTVECVIGSVFSFVQPASNGGFVAPFLFFVHVAAIFELNGF